MLEILLVITVIVIGFSLYFYFTKSSERVEDPTDLPLPEPKVLKTGKWDRLETSVAAFLAIYSEEYYFDKPIEKYARALNRSEGALHAKIRRLRTLEGIPQETSDLGEAIYAQVRGLNDDIAYNYFCDTLSQLALKHEEYQLAEEFRLEQLTF